MSDKHIRRFYDDLYTNNPRIFGEDSTDFLKRVLGQGPLVDFPKALDIGSGSGLTAKYLESEGFSVDAIDLSTQAFAEIGSSRRINLFIGDVKEFPLNQDYDLVLLALVAHHIPKDTFCELIIKLQQHTNESGIHCYRLFTTDSDFFAESEGDGFFDDGQNLDSLYESWRIIHEYSFRAPAKTSSAVNQIREVVYQK